MRAIDFFFTTIDVVKMTHLYRALRRSIGENCEATQTFTSNTFDICERIA